MIDSSVRCSRFASKRIRRHASSTSCRKQPWSRGTCARRASAAVTSVDTCACLPRRRGPFTSPIQCPRRPRGMTAENPTAPRHRTVILESSTCLPAPLPSINRRRQLSRASDSSFRDLLLFTVREISRIATEIFPARQRFHRCLLLASSACEGRLRRRRNNGTNSQYEFRRPAPYRLATGIYGAPRNRVTSCSLRIAML